MLNFIDELLRKILMDGVNRLMSVPETLPAPAPPPPVPPKPPLTDTQIGFGPPDEQWVNTVKNLQLNALNVYLVDLRENRKLRSNERERRFENGMAFDDPAPARLDCHYLISAWSPTEYLTPSSEPILDEHLLLYQAAAALMHASPFNPSRIYPATSGPLNSWPLRFQNADLPAVVAPSEGFPKLAEFWGAMGTGHRWKPVIYLIVTVPVEMIQEVSGYMVTTRITEYRQSGKPETAETWIEIGGLILAGSLRQPASGAWVQLELPRGNAIKTTTTDAHGRFRFAGLQQATYTLRVRVPGFVEAERSLEIPSPTGEYDVQVT